MPRAYPGLTVDETMVGGSICVNGTRLPLWAFVGTAITDGWDSVEANWAPGDYGMDGEALAAFLSDLLEARGDYARLLCAIANAERLARAQNPETLNWPKEALARIRELMDALL